MGAYLKGFLVACQGIPATVFVSVLSVIIGSAAGLLLALMRTSKSKVLNWISKVYVDIVRGTPMVVQALIFAYGIPQFMQAHVLYFKWANLIIPAIIVCGLNSAAYMSEVIRSGIQAVDKGQMEGGKIARHEQVDGYEAYHHSSGYQDYPACSRQRVRNAYQGDLSTQLRRSS